MKALGQCDPKSVARVKYGAVAVVDQRQHGIIDDEGKRHNGEHRAPCGNYPSDTIAVEQRANRHHDPSSDIEPQRIAPHGDGAAAGHGGESDRGGAGPEGQKRHDAAVEAIGSKIGAGFRPRPKQRRCDEQRRQQEEQLAGGEGRRVQNMVKPAARRRGAVPAIGECQKIVVQEPHKMRRDDNDRNRKREIGTGRR